jgi:hypothetical protein
LLCRQYGLAAFTEVVPDALRLASTFIATQIAGLYLRSDVVQLSFHVGVESLHRGSLIIGQIQPRWFGIDHH